MITKIAPKMPFLQFFSFFVSLFAGVGAREGEFGIFPFLSGFSIGGGGGSLGL